MQTLIIILIVLACGAYLLRGILRKKPGKGGCDGNCGGGCSCG
nr:FeoB-associated Cys-rich membrane protein [uncultured Holophaga sp.]